MATPPQGPPPGPKVAGAANSWRFASCEAHDRTSAWLQWVSCKRATRCLVRRCKRPRFSSLREVEWSTSQRVFHVRRAGGRDAAAARWASKSWRVVLAPQRAPQVASWGGAERRQALFTEEIVKVLAHGPPCSGAATRDEGVTWRGAQQPDEGVGPRRSGQRETGDLAMGAAECKPVSGMGGPGPDGGATPPGPNHSPCADKWATISWGAGPGRRSFMTITIG